MSLKAADLYNKGINAMSDELNIDEQVAQIDAAIEEQTWYIDRAEALERLKKNPDFQLVIQEGYLDIELNRVFNMLVMPQTVRQAEKDAYLSQLDAIKGLIAYLGDDRYLGIVKTLGDNAKEELKRLNASKSELILGKGK